MEEYIVSARKYRPMSFDTVVGQAALTTTLKNAVKSGKLAHAYLFCGPRGVGKTTCARIFAKAINCQNPTADGEACNACESCQSFNEQRSLNIFELDAASNNSVEHIKTLMEQTRIPPQIGKYKVFIIDEVHMLSTAAFNAFLKTLEEPPAHVIFILATTEKHKILPTILSRCQIYDFERMTVRNTVNHLKHVAEKEGISYEEEALAVIAEKADGGMRDALSIFDQAASFCQGNITYQQVIEDLNVLDAEYYFRIVDLSLENKVTDVMVLLNDVVNKGFDGGLLIQGLAKHVRNVLMAKDPQTLPLLEVSEQQRQRYQTQAQKCPTPFLYQALKVMNQCDINYRQSSNKRLLVELTLIEVAQLTQPADAPPGSGRRPRRLKTLFKQLVQQSRQQKAAPQVAAVGKEVSEKVAETSDVDKGGASRDQSQTSSSFGEAQPALAEGKGGASRDQSRTSSSISEAQPAIVESKNVQRSPSIKAEALGLSWKNLRRSMSAPSKMNILPGTPGTEQQTTGKTLEFTQQDLELQWMSMCNRMPQRNQALLGLANRMKNMSPVITTPPNVEVTVNNELVKSEMEKVYGAIVATLRMYLQNNQLTLAIRVADNNSQQVIVLSRREQFEEMSRQNPSVEKLREAFDLELA